LSTYLALPAIKELVGSPPAWECLPTLSTIPAACTAGGAVKGDFLTATEDSDKNLKAIAAAKAKIANLTTTIGTTSPVKGLKGATKTAQDLYNAQNVKVTRMQKIVNEVKSALTMHEEELKVLEKPYIESKADLVYKTRLYDKGL